MDRRFVIQFHEAPDGAHYDLMLQAGDALATWRLPSLPAGGTDRQPMPAVKLPDHRCAYLTYEGPVGRGRGSVRIAEAGTFVLLECRDDLWRVELFGRAVRGRFVLARVSGDRWRLSAGAGPPTRTPASDGRR